MTKEKNADNKLLKCINIIFQY